jgi:hypothetical protein
MNKRTDKVSFFSRMLADYVKAIRALTFMDRSHVFQDQIMKAIRNGNVLRKNIIAEYESVLTRNTQLENEVAELNKRLKDQAQLLSQYSHETNDPMEVYEKGG